MPTMGYRIKPLCGKNNEAPTESSEEPKAAGVKKIAFRKSRTMLNRAFCMKKPDQDTKSLGVTIFRSACYDIQSKMACG